MWPIALSYLLLTSPLLISALQLDTMSPNLSILVSRYLHLRIDCSSFFNLVDVRTLVFSLNNPASTIFWSPGKGLSSTFIFQGVSNLSLPCSIALCICCLKILHSLVEWEVALWNLQNFLFFNWLGAIWHDHRATWSALSQARNRRAYLIWWHQSHSSPRLLSPKDLAPLLFFCPNFIQP